MSELRYPSHWVGREGPEPLETRAFRKIALGFMAAVVLFWLGLFGGLVTARVGRSLGRRANGAGGAESGLPSLPAAA